MVPRFRFTLCSSNTERARILVVDFSFGQRTHRFRFSINENSQAENAFVGSATEIRQDGTGIGEALKVYRADNGGQTNPLQALWARKGWYFLRVYYCTAADPRKVPFKLNASAKGAQDPLFPEKKFRMLQAAPGPELFVREVQENGDPQGDETPKDGVDPEGNKLPTDDVAPPQDDDETNDFPVEEPVAAKDDKWTADPDGALVENDGTIDPADIKADEPEATDKATA